MREHSLQAPQRVGHPHGPKAHDGTIIIDRPDELWGTDMTTTATTEVGQVCVFVAVDHCTYGCVGIPTAKAGKPLERVMNSSQVIATTEFVSSKLFGERIP